MSDNPTPTQPQAHYLVVLGQGTGQWGLYSTMEQVQQEISNALVAGVVTLDECFVFKVDKQIMFQRRPVVEPVPELQSKTVEIVGDTLPVLEKGEDPNANIES